MEEIMRQNVAIERVAAQAREQALVEGEVALPGGIREEATVLGCEARLVISGVEPQQDRLAMDGAVVFQVLYRQGEPGDDLRASVQVQDVVASSVDAGDGTRVLRTETVLDIEAESFAPQTLHTLRDAYTLAGDRVALDTRAVNCLSGITALEARETDKQVLPLPADAPPVGRVLAAILTPTATGAEQVGGRVIVEGLLDSQIIYVPAGQTAAVGARQEAPFRIAFQGALPADAAIRLTASNVQAEGISPDRVEVKYVMALDADVISEAAVQLPEGVEKTEAEPERGGLIMVWPQRGESYWDIAKRLRVTVDSIKHLNPSAAPGQALVVMKKGEEGY